MREIEQGITDLNVLFGQVATIVNRQGEQLDNIYDRVDVVYSDMQGADRELRQADRYQRNARSTACWLMLILGIILTIVLLAIFTG